MLVQFHPVWYSQIFKIPYATSYILEKNLEVEIKSEVKGQKVF